MKAVQIASVFNMWMVRFDIEWNRLGAKYTSWGVRKEVVDFEKELRLWLRDNINGDYWVFFARSINQQVEFVSEDDALLCYMRFR